MKKYLLSFLLISNFIIFAQTINKKFLVDLEVNIVQQKSSNSNISNLQDLYGISTSFGYCFSNNYILGANLGYQHVESSYINPALRYFMYGLYGEKLYKINDWIALSGRLNVTLIKGYQGDTDVYGYGFGLSPYVYLDVTKNFGFKFSFANISYQETDHNYNDSNMSDNTVNFSEKKIQLNQETKISIYFKL